MGLLRGLDSDFFYVPLMLSLGFVSHRFGIYLPSAPAARIHTGAPGGSAAIA